MSMRESAETNWGLRIGALFDEAIERLWFAEGKEMRRMVLEQAHQLALEQLGIWMEYGRWKEMEKEIERMQQEYAALKREMRCIAEAMVGPQVFETCHLESVIDWKARVAEREILMKHEFGRNILRLKDEKDNLFETLLLAQTEGMMESVWLATVTMLGNGLTPLQKHVLKQRKAGQHSTRKLIESLD
ncbi:MAG: hypothetical protein JNM43_14095 [Planctomycetaceae bacterium]|nr:hypothetical protein [Planctomycetaceae bacterium]